ncbi:translation elongation factor 4 [Sulfobacillus thermosulfidooxidans]|uniref:translation elongation factor 4 n=1 Tax=Sulfobacillus thermosulfidooxidans TaxID=28034 RepID=UPI00096B8238|nr:translation elongation factor 4 [Sulfobacillus thermosulfidooxidans]OLZ10458.1 elongation factor 4 [Sulfobacillus thermosulfidooxidans]OLZ14286.1 elongation factor 4 [Sulfobacillus thermosulfidooxidans]OLZ19029.1 elongation factor 4 [Sulfobacillus thermosulfidooxidans]
MNQSEIRNFSIIAHIDHGKSTLADRLIERTGTLTAREMAPQVLDSMDLERERGITIKAQAVRLEYEYQGQRYELNLIDTPGHVDFTYEVSRALQACEGALLVIDAAQGVEAQTLANLYLALEHDLTVIPIINKIDLPNANPERVQEELIEIGLDGTEAILVSAKQGIGIDETLAAIVSRIPPPVGNPEAPLRALIFDSRFDSYKGVLVYIRVVDGSLHVGDKIQFMATGASFEVTEIGVFRPHPTTVSSLSTGEVGFFAASIKTVQDTRVGDTVTLSDNPAKEALPGYRPAQPMVFSGLYPVDTSDYGRLREALEKLQLNDASLTFEPETSAALGFGFRAGFLGLLHLDVIQERLEREYNLSLITTAPNVVYQVRLVTGEEIRVDNPALMPPAGDIEEIREPMVSASIITPSEYIGAVMELAQERRGIYKDLSYIDSQRAMLSYSLPLGEIMFDFFDQLKSRTRGYASFDYQWSGFAPSDLVRLDILINGEVVDAFSMIVHRDKAYYRGRTLVEKLRDLIPRQLFEVPLQAAIGGRVIARETVKAMRKDVLAKCYGGDITRKRKLLEKQKEGKKRMKAVGNVEIPQEAFMAILRVDDNK